MILIEGNAWAAGLHWPRHFRPASLAADPARAQRRSRYQASSWRTGESRRGQSRLPAANAVNANSVSRNVDAIEKSANKRLGGSARNMVVRGVQAEEVRAISSSCT